MYPNRCLWTSTACYLSSKLSLLFSHLPFNLAQSPVPPTKKHQQKTGSLYNFVPVKKMLVKPDEWFTQEVRAEGNHIQIFVNGKKTVDYKDPKNPDGYCGMGGTGVSCPVGVGIDLAAS